MLLAFAFSSLATHPFRDGAHRLHHPKIFRCFSWSTLCLRISFSLLSIMSLAFVPRTFTTRQYFVLFFSFLPSYLLNFSILSYSSLPFRYFLPYNPLNYGWQFRSLHDLYARLPYQSSHVFVLLQVGTSPTLLSKLYFSWEGGGGAAIQLQDRNGQSCENAHLQTSNLLHHNRSGISNKGNS